MTDEIKRFLAEKVDGTPRLRLLLDKLFESKPEVLLHYLYGKPTETLELFQPDRVAGVQNETLDRLNVWFRESTSLAGRNGNGNGN